MKPTILAFAILTTTPIPASAGDLYIHAAAGHDFCTDEAIGTVSIGYDFGVIRAEAFNTIRDTGVYTNARVLADIGEHVSVGLDKDANVALQGRVSLSERTSLVLDVQGQMNNDPAHTMVTLGVMRTW